MWISLRGARPIEASWTAPWVTERGQSRTDPAQYTADPAFMARAGAVVVDDPPVYDPESQVLDWSGTAWVVAAIPAAELGVALAATQAAALIELDVAAAKSIERFVPPSRGLPYAEKHRQALAVRAGGAAGAALTAEAAARGFTVPQLAELVLAKAAAWDVALGEIEAARLAGAAAIAAAATPSAVRAALAAVVFPQPAE